jgi:AraC-like DNA-binding protein
MLANTFTRPLPQHNETPCSPNAGRTPMQGVARESGMTDAPAVEAPLQSASLPELESGTMQPCYSARLLPPFMAVLRESGLVPERALKWFDGIDLDQRVHVSAVHSMLENALRVTQDDLLGVKASRSAERGDFGLFDFILSSAPTVRSALESAERYLRLLSDALAVTLEERDDRAIVTFESRVVVPPAAEDFTLCGLIANQVKSWPSGMVDDMDVWFRHAAPARTEEYQQALGRARLHFGAPESGFGFPRRYLEVPLHTRDEKLHVLLRRYADDTLAQLPQSESVTEKVRRVISGQITTGEFSLHETARKLGMSARTLGRRLTAEGTTFKGLVDETRRELALRYVAGQELGLAEVALRAGFSETPSFYRAFRRWTGTTPSKYRWLHRGDPRGMR